MGDGARRSAAGRGGAARRERAGVLAAVISALAFSTEGLLAVGSFQRGADAAVSLAARYAVASLCALAWNALRRRPRTMGAGVAPADLRFLFAAGLLAHGAVPRLLFESFALIPTWLALLLLYAYPALVTAGEHLLGRQRLDARRVVTVAVTFAGVALVARPAGGDPLDLRGVGLALAAAVLNALFLLAVDPVLRRVDVDTAVAAQFAGGVCAHLVLLLVGGSVVARAAAAAPAWPWLLALGVVTSALAVFALNAGVKILGAGRVAIISTLEPVFAIGWGVAVLGEPVGWLQAVGAALVLAGVLGVVRAPATAREGGG